MSCKKILLNTEVIFVRAFASLLVIFSYSCASKKDYSIQKQRTKGDNIVAYGTIKEARTGDSLPYIMVFDQKRTRKVQTDKNGNYKMSLRSGRHRLIASWVGLYNVRTKNISFKSGDSVQVDFLMRDDDRPLID